ncbi:MAG: flagellar biosynthetic protein FliR [Myxococcaceae bacterium]|nr:flagellar biosynthetic protein FliR [Myxococcaceae bacterium]
MSDLAQELTAGLVQAHVVSVAVIAARLLPVAFLCPLLGGQLAPTTVKLGLVLSLSLFLHLPCGVSAPPVGSAFALVALVFREFALGTTIGLVAALPFDAARMGGRFIDLFRGSSAEAALPMTGSRESASGDGLYQALLALAAAGVAMPLVLAALFRSYALISLGGFSPSEEVVTQVVSLVGGAFGTALALGAPIAGVSLAVDAVMGLASRAAPSMNLQDTGAPARILAGGAVLWLSIGVVSERLLAAVVASPDALRSVLEAGR